MKPGAIEQRRATMVGEVRDKMASGAALLLAKRGLDGTSFSTVLELTGAPRGSVYHHFPGGKDELVGAALGAANARTMAALDSMTGAAADDVAKRFLGLWRMVLDRSLFRAGCALLAVTVATDSADLLELTGKYFRGWRSRLAALFEAGGLSSSEAKGFAVLMIAASEGAVVMSRAEQSMEPFDLVADRLLDEISGKLAGRQPVAATGTARRE